MIIRLVHKLQYIWTKNIRKLNVSTEDVALKLFLIGIIMILGYNVFAAYQKGSQNAEVIKEDRIKLEHQQSEYALVLEELNYYASIEYKRQLAREGQNLSEPGEQLYRVNREAIQEVDFFEINNDPILLAEHSNWWKQLILGQ